MAATDRLSLQIDQITDKTMVALGNLNHRTNERAKALYSKYNAGELSWDEYDRQLTELNDSSRLEGERIEKAHSQAMREIQDRIRT